MIYADNAATTPLDPDSFAAMKPFLLERYGNASQPYSFAREPRAALKWARETIADCIGQKPKKSILHLAALKVITGYKKQLFETPYLDKQN